MKQHVKGVVIASIVAIGAVFLFSLVMSSEIHLQKDVVIKQPQEEVYQFIKEPMRVQEWWSDLKGLEIKKKNESELQFIGHDGNLYRLSFAISDNAKGMEINYYEGDDHSGQFTLFTKNAGNETVLTVQQYWNLGLNPIAKLLANKTKEQSEKKLEDDLYRLKILIENE